MSHEATSWAIKQRGIKPSAKIVLFYLADRHNPDFGCFPSQKTLAEDAEMSERSVRDQLDILEERGLIQRVTEHAGGQYKSTRYVLGFEADFQRQNLPPANLASGKIASIPAAKSAVDQRQNLPTNLVREPCKGTSKEEPLIIPQPDDADPVRILASVATADAARSFTAFRRKIRKPLTATGAKRLSKALAEISAQGGDPCDALAMAEERGWQSITAAWYFKELRNAQPSFASPRGQQSGAGQQFTGLVGAAMRRRAERAQGLQG